MNSLSGLHAAFSDFTGYHAVHAAAHAQGLPTPGSLSLVGKLFVLLGDTPPKLVALFSVVLGPMVFFTPGLVYPRLE